MLRWIGKPHFLFTSADVYVRCHSGADLLVRGRYLPPLHNPCSCTKRSCSHPAALVTPCRLFHLSTTAFQSRHPRNHSNNNNNNNTGGSGSSASATKGATGNTVVCPECGKRFLSARNLEQHRRHRHHVHIPSSDELAYEQARQENKQLQHKLVQLQKQIRSLKQQQQQERAEKEDESTTTTATTTTTTATAAADAAAAEYYPALQYTGRTLAVSHATIDAWRKRPDAVGTSAVWCGVGRVVGHVQWGLLAGTLPPSADSTAAAPEELQLDDLAQQQTVPLVLQFWLEVHDHLERRPGQQKLTKATVCVRRLFYPTWVAAAGGEGGGRYAFADTFTVQEGDLLRVEGYYGLHQSYDMVSKQKVENAVLEATSVGLLQSRKCERMTMVKAPSEEERASLPSGSTAPRNPSQTQTQTQQQQTVHVPTKKKKYVVIKRKKKIIKKKAANTNHK